ncbi:bladder cancer-associated protein isoform X5 [Oncorhynchus tshawytscha]|uniref:bladder cancer-associated protein isoform X5 n=1 Tax=Oncorhynchus tshawytscha TaxID=74940 RepID=UPI000D09CA29|nr:bladder cancer-associated protein isoform X5 [Oncorhynchus tshawytscha]
MNKGSVYLRFGCTDQWDCHGYLEWWEDNLKVTETPPDVIEVVKPDQNTFEDHLQARDVEIFDQVRLYMDKAQEKQKESHQMRIKGTKCFDIRANDLAWKKDKRKARPGKPCCSFASGWGPHLLRTASAKAAEALTNEDTLVALEMAEGSGKSATSVKTSCFVIFILLHITNM